MRGEQIGIFLGVLIWFCLLNSEQPAVMFGPQADPMANLLAFFVLPWIGGVVGGLCHRWWLGQVAGLNRFLLQWCFALLFVGSPLLGAWLGGIIGGEVGWWVGLLAGSVVPTVGLWFWLVRNSSTVEPPKSPV
jgi:hypothetical protein